MASELLVLSIDAAGNIPCFSAVCGKKVLFSKDILDRRQTAALLIPLLQESLDQSGLAWKDIDRLCVTTGPGSFTGIRIALATVLGLNLGVKIPVVGVSTFNLWRWCFEQENTEASSFDRVLVALSSGRKDVYGAIFKPGEEEAQKMGVWSGDALREKTSGLNSLCIIGSGQEFVRDALELKPSFFSLSSLKLESLSLWGESLGAEEFYQRSLAPLEPFYLKDPDVTVRR